MIYIVRFFRFIRGGFLWPILAHISLQHRISFDRAEEMFDHSFSVLIQRLLAAFLGIFALLGVPSLFI
jgi:hypothetical protein